MVRNKKKIAAVTGLIALVCALGGCGSTSSSDSAGIYTPGTYTGTGTGMEGDVTATITVDANKITDVKLDVSGETAAIGGAAGDELTQQILDKQSADIDGVSGATMTSNGIKDAVKDALAQASKSSN